MSKLVSAPKKIVTFECECTAVSQCFEDELINGKGECAWCKKMVSILFCGMSSITLIKKQKLKEFSCHFDTKKIISEMLSLSRDSISNWVLNAVFDALTEQGGLTEYLTEYTSLELHKIALKTTPSFKYSAHTVFDAAKKLYVMGLINIEVCGRKAKGYKYKFALKK